MIWNKEVEELARQKVFAAEVGGAEKVKRHKKAGKLTVRERVAALFDDGYKNQSAPSANQLILFRF